MKSVHLLLMTGLCCLISATTGCAAEQRTFSITEPFGLNWGPDRVSYAVAFPRGAVRPEGVRLTDEAGQMVPVQLSELEQWPDKSVKTATVSFMATLTPNQHCTWTLTGGTRRVKPVAGDVKAVLDAAAGTIRLETSKTGVQLLGGKAAFATPMDGAGLPAPIQGVRLPGNQWIGKGWWQTDVKCTGYSALVTDDGPVFARARLRYDFEGGKYYAATVELNAGQDMAVVSEEFNLSEGTGYPMSGLSGMKPEVKYAYVYPKFSSPDRALIWDWWGQTQAKLPTPNEYCFSFGKELQPDRAEFLGYNKYNNIANAGNRTSSGGEGELKYDQDGRFAYINVYGQWGDEETPYLGLYNTQKPTAMLGVVGLRPSQWLHPDIDAAPGYHAPAVYADELPHLRTAHHRRRLFPRAGLSGQARLRHRRHGTHAGRAHWLRAQRAACERSDETGG